MSFGGGSSGGGQTTTQGVTPYSAAEPALGQILSEATNLYGQGVGAAGYVAPTQQTLTGLAQQEAMANAANQQLAATLGGQGISVVKYSDKQDLALEYIKWFARPDVQQKWWDLGGYSCHNDVLNSPSFPTSTVYAQGFLDSMGIVKDFWQEPTFVELMLPMQEAIHDYVVNGKGTAKGALDKIIEEWVEVFEADGKL